MSAVRVWNSAVPDGHYGTVACLVRYAGQPAILSASHVLAPVRRGVSPGANARVLWKNGGAEQAGVLANWDVPLTSDGLPLPRSSDAAFATIDRAGLDELGQALALPSGVRRAEKYGQVAYFYGATSGICKRTIIHDLAGSVPMQYRLYDAVYNYDTVTVDLTGLIQCDAHQPVLGGDSGCLLFDADGYALGILLGTDPDNVYPYFAHLQPILDMFRAEVVTSSEISGARNLCTLIPG